MLLQVLFLQILQYFRMIRLVLENNNFSFNGKHYLQVEGTAIGSRLGMNYASTYLGVWEQQLLEQSSDKPHTYFHAE
jgi:hypothetical protein